jgi:hypothetical protein
MTNPSRCRGGATINRIRSESGAGVRVMLPQQLPPCALDNDLLVEVGIPSMFISPFSLQFYLIFSLIVPFLFTFLAGLACRSHVLMGVHFASVLY